MPSAGAQSVAAQGLPPDSGFAPPAAPDGSGDPWWKRAGHYVIASAMGDAATSAANRGAPWSTITLNASG